MAAMCTKNLRGLSTGGDALNIVQKPIRIVHPITRLIIGGAQENTMYTAASLDKRRYAVEILSGPQTGSEGSLIDEVRSLNIPLTILPDLLRQISPINDLKAYQKMSRLFREREFSIVHTHSSKAGILGRFAARSANVPIIVHTIHGWSFHAYMPGWKRQLYILLERMAAKYSNALIIVSSRDLQKGLDSGIGKPEQYHLIRSAIPLEEFDPSKVDGSNLRKVFGIPMDTPVIGTVSRFSEQKNPLEWVEVASYVHQKNPQAWFLIVGDGPMRSKVECAIQKNALGEQTILTGLRRDIPDLMSAMDIFILTSLWEGLPRVVPQAMAMCLPVLSNRTDGISEAVQDGVTGFLFSPDEPALFAQKCIELIKEPEIRKQMGELGRKTVIREFDLNLMVAQIQDLYDELILKKKRNSYYV